MRLDAIAAATESQLRGSDPSVSAFVSASAGSGKTKLLVDRLLRLMLPGEEREATPPERILCLTFTKAGAANMAIRLRQTLADWVVLDDDALDRALVALDPAGTHSRGRQGRDAARALFARVLDLPGGLRIETIHAFCESLLRRFPLEATISPQFRLVEEVEAGTSLDRAREAAIGIGEVAHLVRLLAARLDTVEHAALTRTLNARAGHLAHLDALDAAGLAAALRTALGIEAADPAALDRAERDGIAAGPFRTVFATLVEEGSATEAERGRRGLDWLSAGAGAQAGSLEAWRSLFFSRELEPAKFPIANSRLGRRRPEIGAAFAGEAARLAAIAFARRAEALVEATVALLGLARPAIAAYRAEKDALGLLDFDDLIARTEALLLDPGTAWVLFKLDGGIDHLLLDEVQDTSDEQWRIAGRLTEEFFAGQGADRPPRTVFAVGDFKQSIFSFQGASPRSFATWRDEFRRRVTEAGASFAEPGLHVSFRSAPAILDFVDAVFADADARAGVAEPGRDAVPAHQSAAAHLPGRVELWPLAPLQADDPTGAADDSPWPVPSRNLGLSTPLQLLAATVADRIAALVAEGEFRPGEIMVLTRRRGDFARAMVRALKIRDVPVAGLDRMVLTEQLAVQDLLALCDALLLPDDELSFATFLTSPLGGLDDDALMTLALDRPGTLRDALAAGAAARPDLARASRMFEHLFGRVDYATPHALLTEVLGEWGGRARILARLGPEAADAIDELLGLALAHAADAIPSMQGFVHWVRRHADELKREAGEPEAGGPGEVRLMTVHGSKGLEVRLVVLSDTVSVPDVSLDRLLWTGDSPSLPVWYPGRDYDSEPARALRAARRVETIEEYNRLLYVGLTRAKERLIVCGWAGRRPMPPECWYARCAAGLERLAGRPGEPVEPLPWGEVRVFSSAPERAAARPSAAVPPTRARAAPIPAWAGAAPDWRARPPPPEPVPRRNLAPSRPDGVAYGPLPPASSPLGTDGRAEARRRGEVLHALLQHLPDLAVERREEAARAYAAARLDPAAVEALVGEALAVLDHPELASLFGPDGRAEQRLAGVVAGIAVAGVVDRMSIGADGIVVADFKSGRAAPDDAARTPVAYLRQMAAYRAVLQSMFADRPVRCRLVWTSGPTVMALPDALLDRHAPGAVA